MTSKAIARSRVQSSVFPLGTFPRRVYESPPSRSACCGATGSVMSRERWDAGLIPSPAPWVKDLALPKLRLRSQLWLDSDPWAQEFHMSRGGKKKKKKKKESTFQCRGPQAWGACRVMMEPGRICLKVTSVPANNTGLLITELLVLAPGPSIQGQGTKHGLWGPEPESHPTSSCLAD